MPKKIHALLLAAVLGLLTTNLYAWDHPGHMTSAAIAFAEIQRERPDLIDKIGLLMLKHPDPAPFWVSAVDAKSEERTRRMFIEAARWPDDAKFTRDDRPTWHSARWPVIAEDAPPEAIKLVESRHGHPSGNAIEALVLHSGILSNPEANPDERALALSWMMHIVGDIHQPLHVSSVDRIALLSHRMCNGMAESRSGSQTYASVPAALPVGKSFENRSLTWSG